MTGDEQVPPTPAESDDEQTAPTQPIRFESDDEVLDDTAPRLGPLPRFQLRDLRSLRRFRRTLQVLGLAAVLAAAAIGGGVAMHDADKRNATQDVHGKMLLHLIGGEGLLQQGDDGSSDTQNIRTAISFGFRDDGTDPVNVVRADLAQPGVTVLASQADQEIQPGQTAVVDIQISIDCGSPQLPRSPDAVTLTVQDPDKKTTTMAFPLAQPPDPAASSPSQQVYIGSTGAESYYDVCGLAANAAPVDVSYGGLTARASATNPQFAFTIKVIAVSAPKAVAGYSNTVDVPGLDIGTGLTGTETAAVGVPLTVAVTVRATDCKLLGSSLAAMSGGDLLGGVENLVDAPVVLIGQADPRFPSFEEPMGIDQNSSAFSTDFLTQLAAACPALQ